MVHPAKQRRIQQGRLADVSTYELMFELVARIQARAFDLQSAGPRQLLVVGRACIEALSLKAQRKED